MKGLYIARARSEKKIICTEKVLKYGKFLSQLKDVIKFVLEVERDKDE